MQKWTVQSQSDASKTYTVTKDDNGDYACTCPQFIYRRQACKHVREIQAKEGIK